METSAKSKSIVIALSGGMDSATLLGYFVEQGYSVHCCTFYYGSKHGILERKAAFEIVKHYQDAGKPVFHYYFDLTTVFKGFDSSLLQSNQGIPEGHYTAETMKSTVVPGRNLIFASILAALAESKNADYVALGVHAGDHYIYPDCRPEFINALQAVVFASSDGTVGVDIPFTQSTKVDILKLAVKNKVPIHLTRTCYTSQVLACGRCGSCVERLEAFKIAGLQDPIKYE